MSDWLMSLIDYKVHGPLGAAVVAIIYFGRKHLLADRKEFGKVDDRFKALETDRVTREDYNRLDGKLDRILLLMAERR